MRSISTLFPGFFASKTARKFERFKEKIGMSKEVDVDYEKLLKHLKRSYKLNKKPTEMIVKYIAGVRITSTVFDSLCDNIKELLDVKHCREEAYVKKIPIMQKELHRMQRDFVNTLDKLYSSIRRNLQVAEADMEQVKAAIHHCQDRRLDSQLKNKKPLSCDSPNLTTTDSDNDKSVASKVVANLCLNDCSDNVPQITVSLYKDAKQRSINFIEGTLQANSKDNFEILTELQPKESSFEIATANGRDVLMAIFHDIVMHSPRFSQDKNLEIPQMCNVIKKVSKDLNRYIDCMNELCQAKTNLFLAVIDTMIESKAKELLKWYPKAKSDMVLQPVSQLRRVVVTLNEKVVELEQASVLNDSVIDSTTSQKPAAENQKKVKQQVIDTLRKCLVDVVQAEKMQSMFAEKIGWTFQKELHTAKSLMGLPEGFYNSNASEDSDSCLSAMEVTISEEEAASCHEGSQLSLGSLEVDEGSCMSHASCLQDIIYSSKVIHNSHPIAQSSNFNEDISESSHSYETMSLSPWSHGSYSSRESSTDKDSSDQAVYTRLGFL